MSRRLGVPAEGAGKKCTARVQPGRADCNRERSA